MEFEKRKAAVLSSLGSGGSGVDKSPKGSLDTPIIPLLDAINSHPCYFTTSSCSGRISILSHPKPQPSSSIKKKARGGTWIFITHETADPEAVLPLLFPTQQPTTAASSEPTDLVLRFEPLIVAVECRDVESAQSLVSLAISCGFRESGITSANKKRVIIGIRCSIRMEVPLGDSGRILVSREYVRFLVDMANQKMAANWSRTQGFFAALKENGFVGPPISPDADDHDKVDDPAAADDDSLERADGNEHNGLLGVPGCHLSISSMSIVGEPVERLFLWGHSSCVVNLTDYKDILIFGGFGGMGRHARRSDSLLLEPLGGTLKVIDFEGAPSPRMGHTASLVGGSMFVIGGRADPKNILNDVWVLNVAQKEWKLAECTGSPFASRHRHAAAVVGSEIYVFGGLNNDTIYPSLHVLDTERLQWKEVLFSGEQPCARHSHSMVAYGSKLFMFGGYNGEKALGDLYSFDVQTCIWEKVKTTGRSPHARFSHPMFVFDNFLGIVGGCPMREHFQELALLDLRVNAWIHVKLDCVGKELLVRSTANILGNDLILIGGGAACYAFGTKFSEPLRINLHPLKSIKSEHMPLQNGEKHVTDQYSEVRGEKNVECQGPQAGDAEALTALTKSADLALKAEKHQFLASRWVLQLQRKYAKLGKDMLKKFGWLDLQRKVYQKEDGLHICFPITDTFYSMFLRLQHHRREVFDEQNNSSLSKPLKQEGVLMSEVSPSAAIGLLKECCATMLADEVGETRRTAKSPLQIMKESVAFLIESKGLSEKLLEQLPVRWERLGDIIVLPVASFKDPSWDPIGEELWPVIARSLNTHRLARQGRVSPTGTRDSTLEILVGDNGWVDHKENGIMYSFDAKKCMFSWGNLSEKLRMAHLGCENEVVVDLFAGIGYFVLPFLVRAKAKFVYACEWNPHAVEALKHNLEANSVSDRCVVLEGDNRITAPKGVADRVCLGLLPTSEGSWATAVRALRGEGGMLHVHGNVKDTEERAWADHVARSIDEIARLEGHHWEVSIEHLERVKWYAPHIRHLVADVRCRQILREHSEMYETYSFS